MALFNTINRHQRTVAAAAAGEAARVAESRAEREADRLRPTTTSHSFLDLLHQNVVAGATPRGSGAPPPPAGAGAGGGRWAVLSDGFLGSKAAAAAGGGGGGDDDDGEDGAPDILDSDSE